MGGLKSSELIQALGVILGSDIPEYMRGSRLRKVEKKAHKCGYFACEEKTVRNYCSSTCCKLDQERDRLLRQKAKQK